MELNCPNCRQALTVTLPDEKERSWVPTILIVGVCLLLGAIVIGFLVMAGLSFPMLARTEALAQAERARAEAAMAEAAEQRARAQANLAAAQLARESGKTDAAGGNQRQLLEDALKFCSELLTNDAAHLTPQRLQEHKNRLTELQKRLAELDRAATPPGEP